ncbi:MAG: carboxypeptidase regulatory-like domain-containing protein [Paucibacter sp.]|nr:carboxypeptidase regulatory-like domain-containing protein [Roseateles sp.]
MNRYRITASTFGAALLAAASCAQAGTIAGTVTTAGQPLAGAMVTAFDGAQKRRDTVYTDALGNYTLNVDFGGKLTLRARAPYFKDATQDITLAVNAKATQVFNLERHSVAEELSVSLPASAHLTTLPWPSHDTRAAFISQCNYCHQVGNALTRAPKDEAGWKQTVTRMEGYFAALTPQEEKDITQVLAKGFDGKPVAAKELYPSQPEVASAKVKEWVVGDAMSFIHDADVGEDERMYGSDEGHDLIWVLDRSTGQITQNKLPDIDLPEGGVFSGVQLPIGVFTGKHGPHSMAQAKDGKFWITNALSSTLASFDPVTKKFKLYELGRTHLYPHTVRIDKEGIVWFTITASNEVGRFDPKTEKFTAIQLPHGFWQGVTDYMFPYILKIGSLFPKQNFQLGVAHHRWANVGRGAFAFPYGIDVNPVDGSIWYAKLYAHKIGRIDPKTLAITEYDTPLKGPRRLRFDKSGILWIPSFDEGGLMKFDSKTARFQTFKLPLLAHNEYEVPYALNVHPKTGDVWITSNMSDRIFRFDPKTETFVTYAMPTRVTWLRDLVFAKDGGICSSSSNLPAYGIEGGLASFICLYPDGEKPVTTASVAKN